MKSKKIAKKIGNILLVIAILISQFSFPVWNINVYAEESTIATKYFYNRLEKDAQLNGRDREFVDDAKVFYNALESMLEKDASGKSAFEKGDESVEILGMINLAKKLDDFANGSQYLLDAMGAGRDAFWLDHSELFYVDFDQITMRVTMDEGGTKHLYIGNGRSANYINKEFLKNDGSIDHDKISGAITTVNDRINKIVTLANAGSTLEEKVKIAHDEIIKLTKYTYEYQTEHPYTVRTIYGVFGLGDGANAGNALCAGYARALKVVLDKLGIPAVIVSGVYYDNNNKPQEHMWIYVEIGGNWYAVDPTFDNTDEVENGAEIIKDKYLLVGEKVMYNHTPSGIISTSNFEFTYPELGYKPVGKSGLEVKVLKPGEGDNKSEFAIARISYNGRGYQKAIDEYGMYMVSCYYVTFIDGTSAPKKWSYMLPEWYNGDKENGMIDTDNYLQISIGNVDYFQMAVTDIVPAEYDPDASIEEIEKMTTFMGDQTQLLEVSDPIYNPEETYYAPPYVESATPSLTRAQTVGKTYNVSIKYNDTLKLIAGEQLGVKVVISDAVLGDKDGNEEIMKYSIKNLKLVNGNTIQFDFTPSKLWIYDSVAYIFQFTGVVGSRSNKAPMSTSYGLVNIPVTCIYQLKDIKAETYAKPVLTDDIDLETIYNSLGKAGLTKDEIDNLRKMKESLLNQIFLVATDTTADEEDEMLKGEYGLNQYLQDEANKSDANKTAKGNTPTVKSSKTYNISLNVCGKQLAEIQGNKIRIKLGFPDGYGPESAGVTFKIYHYTTDKVTGEITGIEEIDCVVTEYGIIAEIDAFSPFTIAAVEKTKADIANTDKTVVFEVDKGGTIEPGDGSKFKATAILQSNEIRTFTVKANDNYIIETIMIGSETVKLNEKEKEHEIVLDYDNLTEKNTMIKITFIAESIYDEESEKGITSITQPITTPDTDGDSNNGQTGSSNPGTDDDSNKGETPSTPNDPSNDNTGNETDNKYEFLEGTVYEFDPKKDSVLKFRVSIPYETFKNNGGKVYVDGKLVDEKYYFVSEGSTIITFTNEFLKTLESGNHTIKFALNDGTEISTTFNIKETVSNNVGSNNAQTSVMDIRIYFVLAVGSLIGIAYIKRKEIA